MTYETIIGLVASITTGISLLPQLFKIINRKRADSISLGTNVLLFIGLSGWVYYGFLKSDWIIIISNLFSLLVNVLITAFSIKYKRAHSRSYYVKKAYSLAGKNVGVKTG